MTNATYLKPSWFLRNIGSRLSPLNRKTVAVLSVYDRMPGVAQSFQRLPDPADHPMFRIAPVPAKGAPDV